MSIFYFRVQVWITLHSSSVCCMCVVMCVVCMYYVFYWINIHNVCINGFALIKLTAAILTTKILTAKILTTTILTATHHVNDNKISNKPIELMLLCFIIIAYSSFKV